MNNTPAVFAYSSSKFKIIVASFIINLITYHHPSKMPILIDALRYTDYIMDMIVAKDGDLLAPLVCSRELLSFGTPNFVQSFSLFRDVALFFFQNETPRATLKYATRLSLEEPLDWQRVDRPPDFDYEETKKFITHFVFLQTIKLENFMKLSKKFLCEAILDPFARKSLNSLFFKDCNLNEYFITDEKEDLTFADVVIEILQYQPGIPETVRKSVLLNLVEGCTPKRLVTRFDHRFLPTSSSISRKVIPILCEQAADLSFKDSEINALALNAIRLLTSCDNLFKFEHFCDSYDHNDNEEAKKADGATSSASSSSSSPGPSVLSTVHFCLSCFSVEIQAAGLELLLTILTGQESPHLISSLNEDSSRSYTDATARVTEFLLASFSSLTLTAPSFRFDDLLNDVIEIAFRCSKMSLSSAASLRKKRGLSLIVPICHVLHALAVCSPKVNLIPLLINKWKFFEKILPWMLNFRFKKENHYEKENDNDNDENTVATVNDQEEEDDDQEDALTIEEVSAEDFKVMLEVRRLGFEILHHFLRNLNDDKTSAKIEKDLRNLFSASRKNFDEESNVSHSSSSFAFGRMQPTPSSSLSVSRIYSSVMKNTFNQLKYGTPNSLFCCIFRLIGFHPVAQSYTLSDSVAIFKFGNKYGTLAKLPHRCFFSRIGSLNAALPSSRLFGISLAHKSFPDVKNTEDANEIIENRNALEMAAQMVSSDTMKICQIWKEGTKRRRRTDDDQQQEVKNNNNSSRDCIPRHRDIKQGDDGFIETLLSMFCLGLLDSEPRPQEVQDGIPTSTKYAFARQCVQLIAHFLFMEGCVRQFVENREKDVQGKMAHQKYMQKILERLNVRDRILAFDKQYDGAADRTLRLLDEAGQLKSCFFLETYTRYVRYYCWN